MTNEFAFHFFTKFKDDHFSLAYMGEVNDDLTLTLMQTNESSIDEPKKFKKKISFLIAECFQNIIRHTDKPEIINQTNHKPNIFLIRNKATEHCIASTNLVASSKKEELESKLNAINTLSSEELKEVYLNSLETNTISDKGGGGLGLIEMARKSEFPLKYDFEFVNYYYSVFYLQVLFSTSKNFDSITKKNIFETFHLNDTKILYNEMLKDNILLIRKGDFSHDTILPLIEIMETNIQANQQFKGSKRKFMYLLVEMLQNISKHALETNGEKQGLFVISSKNDNYILTTGNYLVMKDAESLKILLDNYMSLTAEDLETMYENKLLTNQKNENYNDGLGLLEMIKHSVEKIKYNF